MKRHHGNKDAGMVPITWLLLNSQLTLDLISEMSMLTNIRTLNINQAIRMHCNIGTNIVNRVVEMAGYGTVWYETNSIVNIISI